MLQTRKTDRRIQRTRQLLRDALMALIIENGYESITVQDITDRANVARTTFYLHYKDKDELLFEGMRDIYDELFACTNWELKIRTPEECVGDPADFLHVAEYADFYRVMFSDKGSASFFVRVWHYLAEKIQAQILEPLIKEGNFTPKMPLPAIGYFIAGGQIGLLKWWLKTGMSLPPEKIAYLGEQTITQGMVWALGITES